MSIREENSKIVLTGLLHDIGKFYQRTGARIEKSYYECFMKNNGYKHAAFTAQFIEKYIDPKFHSILQEAANHHTTTTSVIKVADWYASGHDRKSEEDAIKEENETNYISSRLNSIFELIFDNQKNKRSYVNLSKFSNMKMSDKVNYTTIKDCKKEYQKLFDEFVQEVTLIKSNTYTELHHQIYPLIKEYTSTICSSSYNVDYPTVSLFDHLKLTAAFSNLLDDTTSYVEKEFLIVEYDLSGIQKFIYSITEGNDNKSGVAKSLRTRSLYLNILCDFIAYAIINEFDLSYENVLYTSGGKGQVLLRNDDITKDRLRKLFKKIQKEIYKVNKTQISFTFTTVETSLDELNRANFRDIMCHENREIQVSKTQKYNYLLEDPEFSFVGKAINNSCTLCQEAEISNDSLCALCSKLLKLNDQILANNNQFIVEFIYDENIQPGGLYFNFGTLGRICFYSVNEKIILKEKSYYLSVNCLKYGDTKYYAQSNISGISFEDIANNSTGDCKTAVVKMDVDNLGFIFQSGFKMPTISKILTLSRNMDLFFSKIMVSICNLSKFKNSIYVIYSGGDDLAAVVPASLALDFVDEINKQFTDYVGNNIQCHLSAGIEIFTPKSPIRFAIKRAEEMLEEAKSVEGKNSVGILNCAISNRRIKYILDEISYYMKALEDKNISRTSLYNIYTAIILSLDNTNKNAFQKYIPQIAYTISRNVKEEMFIKLRDTFVVRNVSIDTLVEHKIIFSFVLMMTREG